MKRRRLLLGGMGLGAAAFAGGSWLRPDDGGAPHDAYFAALNRELKKNGPARPCLLVDLDRLDHNIDLVVASVARRPGRHYRIVEKSLPCPGLIEYVMRRSGSRRLMSFHQPFLNHDAAMFPDADILLGKPLPVRSVERFYRELRGGFDPARQLQWLVDTPERVAQYLELARGLDARLRLNIEIDVGLHRGGVADPATLSGMLDAIAAEPDRLTFCGFMGYDPHVGMGVPRLLGTPPQLLARVMTVYQACVQTLRAGHPALWREDLTFNTAGSPSYRLHETESLTNDISVGTALLKPGHYELPSLAEHRPAAWIATPVLKATGPVRIPALDDRSRILSWWDVNQRGTFFVYGGHWMADYASPRGLRPNAVYGRSSNQEIVNGAASVGLAVDDHVFLRPHQSEGVLLQFGDLLAVRGARIQEQWPVFTG